MRARKPHAACFIIVTVSTHDGKIIEAKIVPPTSRIRHKSRADLRQWVPRVLSDDDVATAGQCENLVRCYDPCISCSTHFLKRRLTEHESSKNVDRGNR